MEELKTKEWTFKILLLGDMAVGKTSLITQFIERSFETDYRPTLGVNIISKDLEIKETNSLIRLLIWDIAGQDKYEKTRKSYYEGCAGALLVYDLTRYDSFINIESKWVHDIKKHFKKKPYFILIGNKVDLIDNRKVSFQEGKELAEKINANSFLETSALSGANVEEAFLQLVYQILNNYGASINRD